MLASSITIAIGLVGITSLALHSITCQPARARLVRVWNTTSITHVHFQSFPSHNALQQILFYSSLSPVEDRRSVWMHSFPDPPTLEGRVPYIICAVGEVKASGALPHHPHHLPPAITSPPQPPAFKIL